MGHWQSVRQLLPTDAPPAHHRYGASSIAGQSQDGSLGLVATLPINRRQLFRESSLVLAQIAVPLAVAILACVLVGPYSDLTLPTRPVVGTTLAGLLLGVDFGLLSMALGVLTGTRGLTLGLTTAIAAASYLISSLGPAVGWARRPGRPDRHPCSTGPSEVISSLRPLRVGLCRARARGDRTAPQHHPPHRTTRHPLMEYAGVCEHSYGVRCDGASPVALVAA